MFEVGKKYIYTKYGSTAIWECINKIKDTFILINITPDDDVRVWAPKEAHIERLYWNEYKEPQKLKFYVPIYKVDGKLERSSYTYSSNDQRHLAATAIDWVEVEYTEKI